MASSKNPGDYEPGTSLVEQHILIEIPFTGQQLIQQKPEFQIVFTPDGQAETHSGAEWMSGQLKQMERESEANGIIKIGAPFESKHGEKVPVKSPYDAKEDIKSLDWETYHPKWNASRKLWELDADAIGEIVEALTSKNWVVAVDDRAIRDWLTSVVPKDSEFDF